MARLNVIKALRVQAEDRGERPRVDLMTVSPRQTDESRTVFGQWMSGWLERYLEPWSLSLESESGASWEGARC